MILKHGIIYVKNLEDKLVNIKNILNFVHFGLTSQDINSSAYVLSIKNFNTNKLIPLLNEVLENVKVKSRESSQTVILAELMDNQLHRQIWVKN